MSASEEGPIVGRIEDLRDALALIDRRGSRTLREHFDERAGPHAFPRNLWFRGVRCADQSLTPSVLREAEEVLDETALLHEALRFLPDQRLGDLPDPELLAVVQHYGCPTRLLDWSESLFLALWFALTEDVKSPATRDDADGAVHVLAPLVLNAATSVVRYPARVIHTECSADVAMRAAMAFETSRRAWRRRCERDPRVGTGGLAETDPELRRPVAFTARLRTPRIHGQQGVFTLPGGKRYTKAQRSDLANLDERDRMPEPMAMPVRDERGRVIHAKLVIPAACKGDLLLQLLDIGLDPLRMTPGLEGVMATALVRTSARR